MLIKKRYLYYAQLPNLMLTVPSIGMHDNLNYKT